MRSQGSTVRPAPEEQGSARLTPEEPLDNVGRVERPHRMEAESRKPRRELPQQQRELSEPQTEIDRFKLSPHHVGGHRTPLQDAPLTRRLRATSTEGPSTCPIARSASPRPRSTRPGRRDPRF